MRVILPCAGKQTRWKDHHEPKHLISLCGEPILHRTVRLINELVDADIKIVVENPHDPAFKIPCSSRAKARLNPELGDVDKIQSSRHLWDDRGWTLVLFGDVWWSKPAMGRVAEWHDTRGAIRAWGKPDTPIEPWTAFARFGPNDVGGEIFGFAIHPDAHDRFDAAIAEVAKHADAKKEDGQGLFRGGVRGGWGIYRVLTGGNPLVHENRGHYTTIDDWTDDMDRRSDWDEWCWRYEHASDEAREEQINGAPRNV